jgi:hypothetical protein
MEHVNTVGLIVETIEDSLIVANVVKGLQLGRVEATAARPIERDEVSDVLRTETVADVAAG